MLEIKDLSVRYGKQEPTIEHFNLNMKKGEIISVVGESGSGKTTVIRAVLGALAGGGKVTQGDILFNGKSLLTNTKDEWRQLRGTRISMIFQDCGGTLNPIRKIGSQFVEYICTHSKVSKDEAWKKGVSMLEKMRLPEAENIMNSYPHQLSGGMSQRVMIAMAMSCNPQLLIADEPTTALDVTIQAQILELMKKLQKTNQMGIIFITHNLGVVAEICDKVSVMYAGKMVEQGPVDDIFYAPGHPYTRGLLRSMPRVDAESYERLIPIEGTPVDMLNPPEGCPFAPRCESAMKICLQKMPPYVELGDNHRAACWLCVQEQMKAQKAADKNNEKTEAGSHE